MVYIKAGLETRAQTDLDDSIYLFLGVSSACKCPGQNRQVSPEPLSTSPILSFHFSSLWPGVDAGTSENDS